MPVAVTMNLWMPRLFALLAGLLVAASATYWGLKLSAPHDPALPPAGVDNAAAVRDLVPPDSGQIAALLGAKPAAAADSAAPPPASPLASRFVLTGVVASPSAQGVAVIAVDGKPARPYPVGSLVDEGLVLKSVAPRRAVLAASPKGAALLTLELPLPQPVPVAAAPLPTSPVPVGPAPASPAIMQGPAPRP